MYNLSLPMLFKKSLMIVSISYFSFSKSFLRSSLSSIARIQCSLEIIDSGSCNTSYSSRHPFS